MAEATDVSRRLFRSALAHRDFALLWSGQALSAVGNQMFPIALATFVLSRGMGVRQLGEVLAALTVALVAGTAVAAAVGDRWRRVRLMMTADVARMVAVMGIALLPVRLPFTPLIALVVLMGFAEGLFQPAYAAVVPRVVPQALLQPANGLNSFSQYFATIVGPGAAGVLVSFLGPTAVLWVDAATFPLSLLTLVAIREVAPEVCTPEVTGRRRVDLRRAVGDFRQGLREVVIRPWLAASIGTCAAVMTLAVPPALVLVPIVSQQRLGGDFAYGAAMAAIGIGSLVGALVAARIKTRRPGLVALLANACNAASMIGLAFLPLPGVLATWAIAGAGVTVFQVLFITAIQRGVPDAVLTRVMAIDWLGSTALMPLGYALTGPAVERFGTHAVLVGGGAVVVVASLLPLLVRDGTTFSDSHQPGRTRAGEGSRS